MKKLKTLIIDDNPADTLLLQKSICRSEMNLFEFDVATNLDMARQKFIGQTVYDIVFLDLGLPPTSGMETLTAYLDLQISVPTIIMTGVYDATIVEHGLRNGIQDYIVKSRINSENIIRIIEYSITRQRLQSELCNRIVELQKTSRTLIDKTHQIVTLIKDLERPVVVSLQEGEQLANTPMQPEQKKRLHKILASLGVIKVIIEEMAAQENSNAAASSDLPDMASESLRMVSGVKF